MEKLHALILIFFGLMGTAHNTAETNVQNTQEPLPVCAKKEFIIRTADDYIRCSLILNTHSSHADHQAQNRKNENSSKKP